MRVIIGWGVQNPHSMSSWTQPGYYVYKRPWREPAPRSVPSPDPSTVNTDRVGTSRRPSDAIELHVSPYRNSSISCEKVPDDERRNHPGASCHYESSAETKQGHSLRRCKRRLPQELRLSLGIDANRVSARRSGCWKNTYCPVLLSKSVRPSGSVFHSESLYSKALSVSCCLTRW